MVLYYKEQGLNLYEAMIKLYEEYGFTQEELISIELQGKEGEEKIAKCLNSLREDKIIEINGVKVVKVFDYILTEETGLPKSNVLEYDSLLVVRPSGKEPKMKVYLSVSGTSLDNSVKNLKNFRINVMNIINQKLV